MSSPGEAEGRTLPRRDSDMSSHSQSRRRLTRSWSVASGASAGSEGSAVLPPGVRPPSASRVRQRQGIAMRPMEEGGIIVKSGPTVEEKAAVVITAAAKGHVARRQVASLKRDATAKRLQEEHQRQVEAATKITAVAKGGVARRRVAEIRKQETQRKQVQAAAVAAAAERQAAHEAAVAAANQAEIRAAKDAAAAAIREAELRGRNEQEARAELARRTDEMQAEMHAAVRERDVQLARLKGELATQLAAVSSRDATLEELRELVKKLEADLASSLEMNKLLQLDVSDGKTREVNLAKQIKALQRPQMKDACLSPRPLDDSLSVQQRDGIIARQAEQITMLTKQVATLMGGIDQVEDTVNSMQAQVISKDEFAAEKRAESEELRAEVLRLGAQLKELNAREFAMDAATKQNTDLLKLLMKAEEDAAELREELSRAREELIDTQGRHSIRIREAADATARASKAERDARMLREELDHYHSTVGARLTTVTTQLDDTTKAAAVHVDAMADELRVRREKQYELLDKLRVLEEEVDAGGKRAETSNAQLTALQQRNLDLEGQLMGARQAREAAAVAAAGIRSGLEAEVDRLAHTLAAANEESGVLKGQLTQLSTSVVQLAEKEAAALAALERCQETVRARTGEIAVLNERVAQLVDDAIRAQRDRQESDQRAKVALESLTALQKDHAALLARTRGMNESDTSGKPPGPQFATRSIGGDASFGWTGTGTLAGMTGTTALPPALLSVASTVPSADAQLHRLVSAHRLVLRRLVGVHVGTATTTTAPEPASHLLGVSPPGVELSVGGGHIPVASLLFGTDVFGNPATTTRAAVGTFSSAVVGRSGAVPVHSDSGADLDLLRRVGILDLSGLHLNDDDVAVLVHALARTPLGVDSSYPVGPSSTRPLPGVIDAPRPVVAIDLRANHLTDVSAALLARLVSGTLLPETGGVPHVCFGLKLLDVRGNGITSVGLRLLAEALRSNTSLGVQHVYVGAEGMVRALGPKPRVHNDFERSGMAGDGMGIVAILDIRQNTGESVGDAVAAASALLGSVDALVGGSPMKKGGVSGVSRADLAQFRPDSIDRGGGIVPPTALTAPPPPRPPLGSTPAGYGYASYGGGPVDTSRPLRPVVTPAWAVGPPQYGYTAPPSMPPSPPKVPPRSPLHHPATASYRAEADVKSSHADHLAAMAAADEVLGLLGGGSFEPEHTRGSQRTTGTSNTAATKQRLEAERARLRSAERKLMESPYAPKRTESLPLIPPKSR